MTNRIRFLLAMTFALLVCVPSSQADTMDAVDVPLLDGPGNHNPIRLGVDAGDYFAPPRSLGLDIEIADVDILDFSCVFPIEDPSQANCRACVGPGETDALPVEPEGDGVDVGVPNSIGFHIGVDPIQAGANC